MWTVIKDNELGVIAIYFKLLSRNFLGTAVEKQSLSREEIWNRDMKNAKKL
jgi:hypothetical protein